jgi:Uma2 family endonuclease
MLPSITGRAWIMVAIQKYLPRFTPEEYFTWEAQQEVKHEYFDGEVFAMTGGAPNHSKIAVKLTTLLDTHLEESDCQVFNSDARIKIENVNKYVYPDASVTCDERDQDAKQFISYPCLIVEVLSPSTESYDRGNKFELYRKSTSLKEYILVSTNTIAIDLYRQNPQNRWELICFRSADTVEFASINLTFPIERIYRGIKFEPEGNPYL